MKQVLSFFLAFVFTNTSFSQVGEPVNIRKNTISIETYSPIQTSVIENIYNNDWFLGGRESQQRSYRSYSVGVSYERQLGGGLAVRSRLGLSVKDVSEEIVDEYMDELSSGWSSNTFEFQQNNINIFLGIAKNINLANGFHLAMGLELASVFYQEAESDYGLNSWSKVVEYPQFNQESNRLISTKYGKAMNVGIGPIIKPEYTFDNGLCFSIEAQLYFMRTRFNDKHSHTDDHEKMTYNPEKFETFNEEYERTYDITQWSWSAVSPLLRIGYKF